MNDWFEAEQHVERAHEAYERGRWGEAESELRAALARNPYQAEWHFNLGLTLEAAGRFRDAVGAFAESYELADDPDGQTALLAGINALRCDEPSRALEWLDRARELEPESTAALVHRIEAFARLGDHERAETEFYLAQQIDPEDAEAYVSMASSLLDRGLNEKAVWCLREAARLDPDLPRLQARLAEAYAATGRLERARQLYLAELRANPGDVDTLLDLGSLLVRMSRFQESGEKFRRVLEIEPDNVEAHYELGLLAEQLGEPATALRQYEIVLRLDSSYSEARRRVASLILGQVREGDRSLAHRLLRMDLRDTQLRPHAFNERDLDELARLLLDAGLAGEAESLLERLLETDPSNAHRLHLLGVARLERGDLTGGIDACRRALELAPRYVPTLHNLALAYLDNGQWTRARYWVNRALEIQPDDLSVRRLRSRLRLRAVGALIGWMLRPLRPARWRARGPVGF